MLFPALRMLCAALISGAYFNKLELKVFSLDAIKTGQTLLRRNIHRSLLRYPNMTLVCIDVVHVQLSNAVTHIHLQSAGFPRMPSFQLGHNSSNALFCTNSFQALLAVTTTNETTAEICGSPMDIDTDPLSAFTHSLSDGIRTYDSPMDLDPPLPSP